MPIRIRGTLAALITLACASAMLVLVTGHGRAATCPSIDATQAAVAHSIAKDGGASEILTPEETRLYLETLNKEPPVTHLEAERLMYLAKPSGEVIIGFVEGTQVCIAGKVPVAVHARALKAAREHGA